MQQVFLRRLATAASLASAWVLGLTGCTSPQPSEPITVSNASLDAARAAGAEQLASDELARARQKLENARTQAGIGEMAQARRRAEEADVDAQVARSRASAERSRAAAAEVEAGLRALLETMELGNPAKPANPAERSSGSPR